MRAAAYERTRATCGTWSGKIDPDEGTVATLRVVLI